MGQAEKVLAQVFLRELVRAAIIRLREPPHSIHVTLMVLEESHLNCISSIIR
jgi:hypothetical protein